MNQDEECSNFTSVSNSTTWFGSNAIVGISPTIQSWQAILIILSVGAFAIMLAKAFDYLRKNIYKDKDNVDVTFDAGGKVSAGLTATTIVSQWTWAATLLQSSAVATNYGISGPFWYASGATIQIILFSLISVQLKVRAPGAKTFLQVIRARFGKRTHITFCVFGLMTNVIVTSMLMLGGSAVLSSLIKNFSVEFSTGLICAVIGSYTFVGGLGATFYVSYFNTMCMFFIILICIVNIFHSSSNEPLGSAEKVYNILRCSVGPIGNENESYLTMLSVDGLMFGIINIVGNFGTVFVDQSYWQCSVAAKPKDGVLGFLIGGLVWFAVPFSFATTMGLAYLCLEAQQGTPLLTREDVAAGLVPPVVAQRLMGQSGEFLIIVLLIMAIMSTGSAEIMAVTSILVYDIYAIYLRPYRLTTDSNTCILCGKLRGRMSNPRDKCVCLSGKHCIDCNKDDDLRDNCNRAIKPDYRCKTHGAYRVYNNYLSRLKNWCIVLVVILIIPLTLILQSLQISLGWLYLFMGILIGSAVAPICLAMFWTRLTGASMIAGAVFGTLGGLITWLLVAALQPGGLTAQKFMENTGKNMPMLCGNLVSILTGLFLSVVVSLIQGWLKGVPIDENEVWEVTRDIDNPLSTWKDLYANDLRLVGPYTLENRPSLSDVTHTFRNAKYLAWIGSITITTILIFIWPLSMTGIKVMSLTSFSHWVRVAEVWAFTACFVIIGLPLINEIISIYQVMADPQSITPLLDGMIVENNEVIEIENKQTN